MFLNEKQYKKERTYRVIVSYVDGNFSTGSGFFINKNYFITCFHVIFGKELRLLRTDPEFIASIGNDQHLKLNSYFKTHVKKIEVELPDTSRTELILKNFQEKYDIVLLEAYLGKQIVKTCTLDFTSKLTYGDSVNFFGFPIHHSYSFDKTPIAYQEGFISAFVETEIGGEKYQHLQINTINLGGNSGAPLFLKNKKWVVGIINGNMNFGKDNIIELNQFTNQMTKAPFRVPLSIAYSTQLALIEKEASFFESSYIHRKIFMLKLKKIITSLKSSIKSLWH